MGRLPGPFLPPIAMIGPFLDRSHLMGSFGGKSQLPPGGLQKLLRHVLVDQVKVVQVLCAGGGAYLARAQALGCVGLAWKCLGNILQLWLVGPEEEGTAAHGLPQELCVWREGRGLDDVGWNSGLD